VLSLIVFACLCLQFKTPALIVSLKMTTQTTNGVITGEEPDTSHLDGYGVLFGWPIAHSLSPLLHRTIFKSLGLNYDYFLLPSTDIKQFISLVRGSKCYGKFS
jgi:hypothetical protein